MDSSLRKTAIKPSEIVEATNPGLPRILFVPCYRAEAEANGVIGSTLLISLRKEKWSAGRCPTPEICRHRLLGGPLGDLVGRFAAKFQYLRNLIRLIPRHQIVHLDCGAPASIVRMALPALILTKFFGKKAVIQFHSAPAEQFFEQLGNWFHPILRAADKLVVGSRYLQKVIARSHLSATRMTTPVDMAEINHRTISRLQPNILMYCPLEDDYNLTCALKGFRLVKQKYPRSELTIAGDGPQYENLEHFVEKHRIYGVKFVKVDDPQIVHELYHQADLYLHSATVDESPASIVMAFAAGLPVVTTDADGLLHLVRDRANALVVPVNDHVALADRIIELIENSDLTQQLSGQGLAEAIKFGWSRVRQDWVNLYQSLVSEQAESPVSDSLTSPVKN